MTERHSLYQCAEDAFAKAVKAGCTSPMPIDAPWHRAKKLKQKFLFEQTEPVALKTSIRPSADPVPYILVRRSTLNNKHEPTYIVIAENQPKVVIEAARVLGQLTLLSTQLHELPLADRPALEQKLSSIEEAFS